MILQQLAALSDPPAVGQVKVCLTELSGDADVDVRYHAQIALAACG